MTHKKTVLIVEDNIMVRELMVVTLSGLYQTLTASSAEEALVLIGLLPEPPDMVLLDLHLNHGMSGLELCQRLRQQVSTRGIAILIISGDAEGARVAARRVQANGYLSKPYSPVYLLDRIESLLEVEGSC